MVLCARLRANRVHVRRRRRRAGPGWRPRPASTAPRSAAPTRRPGPGPSVTRGAETARYGTVQVAAWDRMHPKLAKTGAWPGHHGKIPRHRGHPDPAAGDRLPGYRELKPLWLWASRHRRRRRRGHRAVAGVLAPLRPGAHLPVLQAGPGLERPAAARPCRRRPVDLADHRRLHPAPAGPAPRRRPAAALAAACPARAADPARVRRGFRRVRDTAGSRSPAETRQTRPRPPDGLQQPPPAPRHDVGKTTPRELTLRARRERTG